MDFSGLKAKTGASPEKHNIGVLSNQEHGCILCPSKCHYKNSPWDGAGTASSENQFHHHQSPRDESLIVKWEQRELTPVMSNSAPENFHILIFENDTPCIEMILSFILSISYPNYFKIHASENLLTLLAYILRFVIPHDYLE